YDKISENDARWYTLDFWLDYFSLGVKQEELLQRYANTVSLYPDVVPTLNNLSKKYTLIVCSGMSREFIDVKLKKENIVKYFNHIFSAVSNFNLTKKEPYFYEKVCQELNVKPSHLIHIGDNYELDYLVPKKIGIKAFYLDRTNSILKEKETIGSLQELIGRLSLS
ncbi:HAD family hydrolase, partial [Candidatus Aerophobetes bacterium]|nr:HAD family hydrolase [Candidatus Aerophobetes bacterium]